jgi:hypothetical protein
MRKVFPATPRIATIPGVDFFLAPPRLTTVLRWRKRE